MMMLAKDKADAAGMPSVVGRELGRGRKRCFARARIKQT